MLRFMWGGENNVIQTQALYLSQNRAKIIPIQSGSETRQQILEVILMNLFRGCLNILLPCILFWVILIAVVMYFL